MGSLDCEFLFVVEAWGSADATSQNSSLRCHVPGKRLLREAGGKGEPVMLPAGCSQQRQPGETLGRSVAGVGAAVGGGHASFPLGKPGILSIPRRRDSCHRHTSPPQLREDESPAHSFCPLSPTGSTKLSESPLHLGRVTKLALRLPASLGNLKALPPMFAQPYARSRTGISQDSPATLTQAQCVSPSLRRLFVFSGPHEC